MKGAGPTASAQGDVVGAAMAVARGLKSRRTYAIKFSPQGRFRLGNELTLPSPKEIEVPGPGPQIGIDHTPSRKEKADEESGDPYERDPLPAL